MKTLMTQLLIAIGVCGFTMTLMSSGPIGFTIPIAFAVLFFIIYIIGCWLNYP